MNGHFYLGLATGVLAGLPILWLLKRCRPLLCRVLPHAWEHTAWDGDFRELTCARCRKSDRRDFGRS